MHIVTLSFDDGFERSSVRTAEIFERHGLVAELNVLAAGHLGEPEDAWHKKWRKGDFALWNELKARGHHVMPHGYRHANKAELPLHEAQRLIERCLDATWQSEVRHLAPSRLGKAASENGARRDPEVRIIGMPMGVMRQASIGTAISSSHSAADWRWRGARRPDALHRARGLRPRFRGNAARCCLAGL